MTVFIANHARFRTEIQPGQYVSGARPRLLATIFTEDLLLIQRKNKTKRKHRSVLTSFFSGKTNSRTNAIWVSKMSSFRPSVPAATRGHTVAN